MNMTNLAAVIIKYLPNNVNTDYDDGTFEWFDSSELLILYPDKHKGKKIYIDHNKPQAEDSFWRSIGTILHFALDDEIDFKATQIFSDGVDVMALENSGDYLDENKYSHILGFESNLTCFYFTHGESGPFINHAGCTVINFTNAAQIIKIDRAEFYRSNSNNKNMKLELTRATADINKEKREYKFREDIGLNPNSKILLNIMFKGFQHNPVFNEKMTVILHLSCKNRKYAVYCPIGIVRKEPSR